ncbi:MAG TPA: hypothetical protein VFL90_03780, partial [Methylomirabilota bacterium]|nr:hypothetical protein [Methylomirabilota bacterium]
MTAVASDRPDGLKHLVQGPLFQGLGATDVAAITATAQRRRAARGAAFFHQGTPASALHLLTLG